MCKRSGEGGRDAEHTKSHFTKHQIDKEKVQRFECRLELDLSIIPILVNVNLHLAIALVPSSKPLDVGIICDVFRSVAWKDKIRNNDILWYDSTFGR